MLFGAVSLNFHLSVENLNISTLIFIYLLFFEHSLPFEDQKWIVVSIFCFNGNGGLLKIEVPSLKICKSSPGKQPFTLYNCTRASRQHELFFRRW